MIAAVFSSTSQILFADKDAYDAAQHGTNLNDVLHD